jgi:hypothetical protein
MTTTEVGFGLLPDEQQFPIGGEVPLPEPVAQDRLRRGVERWQAIPCFAPGPRADPVILQAQREQSLGHVGFGGAHSDRLAWRTSPRSALASITELEPQWLRGERRCLDRARHDRPDVFGLKVRSRS